MKHVVSRDLFSAFLFCAGHVYLLMIKSFADTFFVLGRSVVHNVITRKPTWYGTISRFRLAIVFSKSFALFLV